MNHDAGALDDIAAELYRLPLDEFIPARDARVKTARKQDRELAAAIGRLRKPSSAAWVVNQLVGERPELIGQLSDLADALRAAQESLSGDQIRGLSAQRHQVVASMVRESRRLAGARGVKVGDAVQRELEATFDAALADPAAAQALRSGRLTTALSYAGLGDAGTGSAAPQAPPKPQQKSPQPSKVRSQPSEEQSRQAAAERERQKARQAAEQALANAERDLHAVEEERSSAVTANEEAASARDEAHQRVADLTAALEQAQAEATAAATAVRETQRARSRAEHRFQEAQRRRERALGAVEKFELKARQRAE